MSQNPEKQTRTFTWMLVFFGLAYFCQHFGQAGLVMQPLKYYLREVMHYDTLQITQYFNLLTWPWVAKPLYGLISDYFPILGYRRKSYLLIVNCLASVGFLAVWGVTDAYAVQMALLLTAFSTAFSDVAIDGLMVELGNKTGQTQQFQSQQWLWFNIATVVTSLGGGYISEMFAPAEAFRWTALITVVFPAVVALATWHWVKEEKAVVDKAALAETTKGLLQALKSKTLWTVVAFILFWQFKPDFGDPMLIHMRETLGFSKSLIGWLGAVGAIAAVIGAFIFGKFFAAKVDTRTLLYWTGGIAVASSLSNLLLVSPVTGTPAVALGLTAVFGMLGPVTLLAILNLAAEACPKKVEALTFAALMSVYNFGNRGGETLGSYLYEDVVGHNMTVLSLIAAAMVLVCIGLIRFLPKANADAK